MIDPALALYIVGMVSSYLLLSILLPMEGLSNYDLDDRVIKIFLGSISWPLLLLVGALYWIVTKSFSLGRVSTERLYILTHRKKKENK